MTACHGRFASDRSIGGAAKVAPEEQHEDAKRVDMYIDLIEDMDAFSQLRETGMRSKRWRPTWIRFSVFGKANGDPEKASLRIVFSVRIVACFRAALNAAYS